MKYSVSSDDLIVIEDFIKSSENMSIFNLMRVLNCTPERAVYIFLEILPKKIRGRDGTNSGDNRLSII